mmetsp:Transcript_28280/g.72112  ORF Transcript_28280/g.72112 Transcript_28280/m.72112 type:complete len:302 (+) Transcript_28280:838-1743(+)
MTPPTCSAPTTLGRPSSPRWGTSTWRRWAAPWRPSRPPRRASCDPGGPWWCRARCTRRPLRCCRARRETRGVSWCRPRSRWWPSTRGTTRWMSPPRTRCASACPCVLARAACCLPTGARGRCSCGWWVRTSTTTSPLPSPRAPSCGQRGGTSLTRPSQPACRQHTCLAGCRCCRPRGHPVRWARAQAHLAPSRPGWCWTARTRPRRPAAWPPPCATPSLTRRWRWWWPWRRTRSTARSWRGFGIWRRWPRCSRRCLWWAATTEQRPQARWQLSGRQRACSSRTCRQGASARHAAGSSSKPA